MAGTFPNISAAYPVRFPYVHTLLIRCDVKSFWSGTSQRYAISGLLNSFKWNYRRISVADLETLQTFWTAQKGAFDYTWSISLVDPTTKAVRSYANMAFDSDTFGYAESPAQWFALGLDAVQTISEAVTVVLPTGTLPILSTGAFVQIPFGTAPSFKTFRNDLDSGKRISWAAWPVPLTKWALSYPAITDAEVQTLVNFYLGAGGAVNSFAFIDPNTAVSHASCYFGAQGIQLTRISPNVNSISCSIEEFAT
jgi:hypothetical protein